MPSLPTGSRVKTQRRTSVPRVFSSRLSGGGQRRWRQHRRNHATTARLRRCVRRRVSRASQRHRGGMDNNNNNNKKETSDKKPYTVEHAKSYFKFYTYAAPYDTDDSRKPLQDVIGGVPYPIYSWGTNANASRTMRYLRDIEKALQDKSLWNDNIKSVFDQYQNGMTLYYNKDIRKEEIQDKKRVDLLGMILCVPDDKNPIYPDLLTKDDPKPPSYTNLISALSTLSKYARTSDKPYLNEKRWETYTNVIDRRNYAEHIQPFDALGRALKTTTETIDDVEFLTYLHRFKSVMELLRKTVNASTHVLTRKQMKHFRIAQQRQLLMLLVGDVPGTLFVNDTNGQHHNHEQIYTAIHTLLDDYRMSHGSTPMLTLRKAYGMVNLVKTSGMRLMSMVGWLFVALLTLAVGLCAMYYLIMTQFPTQLVQAGWVKMLGVFFYGLEILFWALGIIMQRLEVPGSGIMIWARGFFKAGRAWMNESSPTRAMLTKFVQVVLFGVLMKVISGFKTDCGYNRRLAHIFVPIQKTLDYYKLLMLSNQLNVLEPGLFGDTTVSGISDAQFGAMKRCQHIHESLDEYIHNLTPTQYAFMLKHLTQQAYRAHNRVRLDLYSALDEGKRTALAGNANSTLSEYRKLLLDPNKGWPHEIRGHHLYNHRGFPRKRLDIVKAYFCDVWRQKEDAKQHKMTHIPSNDSQWHRLLSKHAWDTEHGNVRRDAVLDTTVTLNPIETAYQAMIDAKATIAENDSPEHDRFIADYDKATDKYASATIDLDKVFLSERMQEWFEPIMGDTAHDRAMFREEMRKYLRSGWTHKVGKHIQTSVEKRFKIVTFEMMYQEFLEKQGDISSQVTRKTRKKAVLTRSGKMTLALPEELQGEIDRLRKSTAYSSTLYDKDYAAKLLLPTTTWATELEELATKIDDAKDSPTKVSKEGASLYTTEQKKPVYTDGDGNCGLYALLQIVLERCPIDKKPASKWGWVTTPMINEAMRNLLTEPSFIPDALKHIYSRLGHIRFNTEYVDAFKRSLEAFINQKNNFLTPDDQQDAKQVIENDAVNTPDGWCNPAFILAVSNYYEIPIELNHRTQDFQVSFNPNTSSITYQAYLSYQLLPDGGTLGHYEYAISDFDKSLENLEKNLTPSTK